MVLDGRDIVTKFTGGVCSSLANLSYQTGQRSEDSPGTGINWTLAIPVALDGDGLAVQSSHCLLDWLIALGQWYTGDNPTFWLDNGVTTPQGRV